MYRFESKIENEILRSTRDYLVVSTFLFRKIYKLLGPTTTILLNKSGLSLMATLPTQPTQLKNYTRMPWTASAVPGGTPSGGF